MAAEARELPPDQHAGRRGAARADEKRRSAPPPPTVNATPLRKSRRLIGRSIPRLFVAFREGHRRLLRGWFARRSFARFAGTG